MKHFTAKKLTSVILSIVCLLTIAFSAASCTGNTASTIDTTENTTAESTTVEVTTEEYTTAEPTTADLQQKSYRENQRKTDRKPTDRKKRLRHRKVLKLLILPLPFRPENMLQSVLTGSQILTTT